MVSGYVRIHIMAGWKCSHNDHHCPAGAPLLYFKGREIESLCKKLLVLTSLLFFNIISPGVFPGLCGGKPVPSARHLRTQRYRRARDYPGSGKIPFKIRSAVCGLSCEPLPDLRRLLKVQPGRQTWNWPVNKRRPECRDR